MRQGVDRNQDFVEDDMDLLFVVFTILFFAVSGWLVSSLEKL
jgi:hypothetical protein